MRVLWASNAPWAPTGYGQQSGEVVRRLAARYGPDEVAVACNYGLQGQSIRWEGVRCYPSGLSPYSDDVIPVHADHWLAGGPGWVVTLFDVLVFRNPAWRDFHVASWVPVDHDPVPPQVAAWFTEFGAVPIAMSRFGEQQLDAAGLDPLYVPHSVDLDTFTPGPADRAQFGLSGSAFVVGMVAANKGNPSRKGFPEAFEAFARFARDVPDAQLFVWSEQFGANDGINLDDLADMCGISDRVVFSDQYRQRVGGSAAELAAAYRCMDVLLAPSYGEGFGVPVIEAQACGVPVIVNDFSAQTELCGVGWRVKGQRWADMRQRAWWQVPFVGELVDALREAATSVPDRDGCRRFAARYGADEVWGRYWLPVLEVLEGRLPDVSPLSSAHNPSPVPT